MTRRLCTANTPDCPNCWQAGYRAAVDLACVHALSRRQTDILRTVLADDAYAETFETTAKYRKALIRYLERGDK